MLPQTSKAIEWIAPTRLERMRCPARIAFKQQGDGKAPSVATALLGTTVHRAMEFVAKGTDVEDAWGIACEEMSTGEDVDPSLLEGFRRTFLRYRRRANELVSYLAEHSGLDPLPEEDLRSEDGVLRGQADLVLLGTDHLIVIDHKTGIVTEEDRPKAAYVRQLQIYAALASAAYERPVVEATLFSLREGMVAIDVSDEALGAAISEARRELTEFNQRAPGPQPARASPDTCRWCPFAARCDGFWRCVDESWLDAVGLCVRGHVTRAEVALNGVGSIELAVTEAAPPASESVVVSGVPGHHLAGLPLGGRVSLTGLERHFRDPETLVWTSGSLINVI